MTSRCVCARCTQGRNRVAVTRRTRLIQQHESTLTGLHDDRAVLALVPEAVESLPRLSQAPSERARQRSHGYLCVANTSLSCCRCWFYFSSVGQVPSSPTFPLQSSRVLASLPFLVRYSSKGFPGRGRSGGTKMAARSLMHISIVHKILNTGGEG